MAATRPIRIAIDAEALASAVDVVRETMRAFVAGLVEDGFTDEQARDIVAGSLRHRNDDDS